MSTTSARTPARTSARAVATAAEPPLGPSDRLAPVRAGEYRPAREGWGGRLVLFLRVMAGVTMLKGLYHWWSVCGFAAGPGEVFDARSLPWQTATVFFAVIDLVASVGLWLAAPWGALVWLTGSVTMIVVQAFFPAIYGFHPTVVVLLAAMIGGYLVLAVLAAREQAA